MKGVANQLLADLDELQEALARRCVELYEQPECLHSHTLYHWWPEAA